MDLASRLRAIVRSGPGPSPSKPVRELSYEPDTGGYEAAMGLTRVGQILGGCPVDTPFGACLVVDRRYESDRWHGGVQIGDCEVVDSRALGILDPSLPAGRPGDGARARDVFGTRRTIFIDLETTGLSGGAGTVAFLVGCGFFDLGAFQVRQFLLTSHAAERALLHAVAQFFAGADLIVTYNGKTFDVPVMETRWLFHRIQMPLDGVAHLDMLHPARRLWKARAASASDRDDASAPKLGLHVEAPGIRGAQRRGARLVRRSAGESDGREGGGLDESDGGCRLTTLERMLFEVRRVGDVDGFEIPSRFFHFLRSGDPRPLEPVLEHNRLDLVSLAAVMGRAARLARDGEASCRDASEALALGRIFERAGVHDRAEACYRRAVCSTGVEVRGEALYRIGLRYRRERRFTEAAGIWREVVALAEGSGACRLSSMVALRQFATEALAIHHEHRERDLAGARELARFALEDAGPRQAEGVRHRLARLDRKLQKKKDARQLSVLQD